LVIGFGKYQLVCHYWRNVTNIHPNIEGNNGYHDEGVEIGIMRDFADNETSKKD